MGKQYQASQLIVREPIDLWQHISFIVEILNGEINNSTMINESKMNITIPDDCGNSPRKSFIVEFNQAFATWDIKYILEHVSDNILWTMVGSKDVIGKAAMEHELQEMKLKTGGKASSMILHSIITHGREAAANGEFHYPGDERIAFCDVFQFTKTTGNTVKRITSYAVSL